MSFARAVILFLSFPQSVIRMRFSVPEGRTRRRPAASVYTFSSYSFSRFSATPDLKACF